MVNAYMFLWDVRHPSTGYTPCGGAEYKEAILRYRPLVSGPFSEQPVVKLVTSDRRSGTPCVVAHITTKCCYLYAKNMADAMSTMALRGRCKPVVADLCNRLSNVALQVLH